MPVRERDWRDGRERKRKKERERERERERKRLAMIELTKFNGRLEQ